MTTDVLDRAIFGAFAETISSPERPDIVDWCESNRTLRGAHGGPWRRNYCKWSLEIMRACVDAHTRVVVVRGASQIAKTESLLLNVWAYKTVWDPAPSMFVLPSQITARDFSHQRVEPLIETTPPLKALVSERGTGPRTQGASTIRFRTYPGGFLKLVGSLSASELSQMAIRDLYATELDRFAIETENSEGDPVHLMKLRQRTFEHTAKLIMECSPTIAGESRIELEYQAGSQEHYFLPCPRCGFEQELLKPNFDWESATYRCVNCSESSSQRSWQSRVGRWISCIPSSRGDDDRDRDGDQLNQWPIRSFWVPAWLSELVSWQKIGEDYRRAKELLALGDKSNLKTWVQTTVAEPWVEEQRPAIRGGEILSRTEQYDAEVPDGVLALVACIDTQDEALKYLVAGVGLGKEVWLIEAGAILGNLEHEGSAVYAELEERVLNRDWHCGNGKVMRIRRACQDAGGHHAGAVYEYVKRAPQLLWAFRAVESRPGTPIWKRGRSLDERIPLLLGATTLAKDLLLNRLEIPVPGPGFIHIGGRDRGFDEAWSKEMTSERKEVVFRGGIQKTVWRRLSTSQPNDAWDLCCMTLILIESMKLRFSEETKPDYYEPKAVGEESGAKNGQPPQPKWGAQPANVSDPYILALQAEQRAQRGQQVPNGMRWGAQNSPITW